MPDGPTTLMPVLDALLDRKGEHTAYSDELKIGALTVAISAFEQEANIVFFPREITETIDSPGGPQLALGYTNAQDVTSITGPNGDEADISAVIVFDDELRAPAGSQWAAGLYTLVYTAGLTSCPDDVQRAIALIASSLLAAGPWDDRGYAIADDAGVMRLLTAGISGASFSIPEVQAALQRVRDPWAGAT